MQSDVLRFLLRVRCWEYRQLNVVHRASRPSRPDKARRLGYKASRSLRFYFDSTARTPSPRLARQSVGTEIGVRWVDWARGIGDRLDPCGPGRAGAGSSKISLDGEDQHAERVEGHAKPMRRETYCAGMLTVPYAVFASPNRPSRALSSTASVFAAVTASAPSPRVSPTPSFPLSRCSLVFLAAGQEVSGGSVVVGGGTDPLLPVTLPLAVDTLGLLGFGLEKVLRTVSPPTRVSTSSSSSVRSVRPPRSASPAAAVTSASSTRTGFVLAFPALGLAGA